MFKRKGIILVLGILPLIWASQGYSYDETDPAIANYLRNKEKEKESAQAQETSMIVQPQAAPQAQSRPLQQQPEVIIIPPSTSQSGPQPLLKTAPQAPPPRLDQSSDYGYTPDAPAIPKLPGAAVPAPVRNNVEPPPQQNQQTNWWQQAPKKTPTNTQNQPSQMVPAATAGVQPVSASAPQPVAPSQQSRSFFQFVPNNSDQSGQQGVARRSIYQ